MADQTVLRIRGGVEWVPLTHRWHCVVHIWRDATGEGPPDQAYSWPESYATEAEAAHAYATHVRPALVHMQQEAVRTGATCHLHQWGFLPHGGTSAHA